MSNKGYWMAMVDVRDPEVYRKYIESNGVAFAKYGAKFLVRAGRHTEPEGPTGNRHGAYGACIERLDGNAVIGP